MTWLLLGQRLRLCGFKVARGQSTLEFCVPGPVIVRVAESPAVIIIIIIIMHNGLLHVTVLVTPAVALPVATSSLPVTHWQAQSLS